MTLPQQPMQHLCGLHERVFRVVVLNTFSSYVRLLILVEFRHRGKLEMSLSDRVFILI